MQDRAGHQHLIIIHTPMQQINSLYMGHPHTTTTIPFTESSEGISSHKQMQLLSQPQSKIGMYEHSFSMHPQTFHHYPQFLMDNRSQVIKLIETSLNKRSMQETDVPMDVHQVKIQPEQKLDDNQAHLIQLIHMLQIERQLLLKQQLMIDLEVQRLSQTKQVVLPIDNELRLINYHSHSSQLMPTSLNNTLQQVQGQQQLPQKQLIAPYQTQTTSPHTESSTVLLSSPAAGFKVIKQQHCQELQIKSKEARPVGSLDITQLIEYISFLWHHHPHELLTSEIFTQAIGESTTHRDTSQKIKKNTNQSIQEEDFKNIDCFKPNRNVRSSIDSVSTVSEDQRTSECSRTQSSSSFCLTISPCEPIALSFQATQPDINVANKQKGHQYRKEILQKHEKLLHRIDIAHSFKVYRPTSPRNQTNACKLDPSDIINQVKVGFQSQEDYQKAYLLVQESLHDFKSNYKTYFKKERSQKEMMKDTKFHNLNKRIMRVLLALLNHSQLNELLGVPLAARHFFEGLEKKFVASSKKQIRNTQISDQYSHAHYNTMFLQINELNYFKLATSNSDVKLHKMVFKFDLSKYSFEEISHEIQKANILKQYVFKALDCILKMNDSLNDQSIQTIRSLYIQRVLRGMTKMNAGTIVQRF